jgi:hypothetical protein
VVSAGRQVRRRKMASFVPYHANKRRNGEDYGIAAVIGLRAHRSTFFGQIDPRITVAPSDREARRECTVSPFMGISRPRRSVALHERARAPRYTSTGVAQGSSSSGSASGTAPPPDDPASGVPFASRG